VDVPPALVRACKDLFDVAYPHPQRAALAADTIVRSGGVLVRRLRYETRDKNVTISAHYDQAARALQVRCVPAADGTLVIDRRVSEPTVGVLRTGRARVQPVVSGWTSLLVDLAGEAGGRVRTVWTRL
jgi:hypothetical protein